MQFNNEIEHILAIDLIDSYKQSIHFSGIMAHNLISLIF